MCGGTGVDFDRHKADLPSLPEFPGVSRSPGIVKKTPGIEGILFLKKICARNANFGRI